MVKVLENRVVDLDLLPGTKDPQGAAKQAIESATGDVPSGNPQDSTPAQNASNAAMAAAGALGGTVKGVVDTAGNTVGTLGEGLVGTGVGVGKGLGSAASFGGNAVGGAFGFSGKSGKQTETAPTTEGVGSGVSDNKRRKSEHEENISALNEFEKQEPIQLNDAGDQEEYSPRNNLAYAS